MPDQPALTPIAPARIAEEIRKICGAHQRGEIKADDYEHRFSRMIGELRDRKIDGNRVEILAALTPLKDEAIVTLQEWARLTKQLGLA